MHAESSYAGEQVVCHHPLSVGCDKQSQPEPFDPVSPKRFLLIPLTLLVGLGIGAAVAYLLQQMRPVFVSGQGLAAFTGLPLLGVVSLMWPERQQLAARKSYLRYGLLAGCLVFVCAILLWKQEPWSSAIRRMLGDRSVA